jgi:hypothetical protein
VGLAGENTPDATLARLIPTLRNDISSETDRLRNMVFAHHGRLRERGHPTDNARALADFLSLPAEQLHEVVADRSLFAE